MKKCKECSYELNITDGNSCPRCGGIDFIFIDSAGNVTKKSTASDNLRNTIKDSDYKNSIIGEKTSMIENSAERTNYNCPRCNYLNLSQTLICPNCNYQLKNPDVDSKSTLKKTVKIHEFSAIEQKIVNPSFELIPIESEGKIITIQFSNEEIFSISRTDIDNTDESISANGHCEFRLENGSLIIKNVSSNQALFKLIKDEILIENDDIILIGKNKFYKARIK